MPYRRLPNTDQARIRALKAVVAKGDIYNVYDLAVSLKTLTDARNFLMKFEAAQAYYAECFERQAKAGRKHQSNVKIALADALYTGKIAGAALDVTDPEPLPADHRLWNAPNFLITPHVSGGFSLPETLEKIVGLFADNLERYFAGQPIENLVNLQTGYRE